MRLGGTLAAFAAALAVSGCGGPVGDLFLVERSGRLPGARLTLVVSYRGEASCNGGRPRAMGDKRLLAARGLARRLRAVPPARRVVPPGRGALLRYRVRLPKATLSFTDTSRPLPPALAAIQTFTRDVARRVCRLPR